MSFLSILMSVLYSIFHADTVLIYWGPFPFIQCSDCRMTKNWSSSKANKSVHLQNRFLNSTLAAPSTCAEKQFGNLTKTETFASLSTISFPSERDPKDSNDQSQRDTERPETMAFPHGTQFATPARDDDDLASMGSAASVATTIFDGLEDERLDNVREARGYVSTTCRAFIKTHDDAKEDEDDLDLAAEADSQRLKCVKAAWRFVEFARSEFASCSDFDVQGRENVAAFIKGYQQKICIRPIIQEDLRDVAGYSQKFPTRDDVVAPIPAPIFAAPFNVPDITTPSAAQRKRNLTDESTGPNPSEKRGRQGSTPAFDDNDPLNLNVAGAAAPPPGATAPPGAAEPLGAAAPSGATAPPPLRRNLLPPGAKSKRAENWVLDHSRDKSPTNQLRKNELKGLQEQTAAINRGREENERELAKWKATKEKLAKDLEDMQKRKEAKREKERKEKEKKEARKHHIAVERNNEFQREALTKAANTSTELQQMQEIVAQMTAQCNIMADELADDIPTDDDDDMGFELVQSKKKKKKTPIKASRPSLPPPSLADLPPPPPTTTVTPAPAQRRRNSVRLGGLVEHAGNVNQEPAPLRAHNGGGDRDLAWLQTQQLAQTYAQNARPAEPFETGSANQYAIHMARFDLVANTRGMDNRAKVLELSNWFTGTAKQLIDSESANVDADIAYHNARAELNLLFGGNNDSISALLSFVKIGKPIDPEDYKGHLSLYGQLRAAETTATASGKRQDLDRKDVLEVILEKKLPHMREKFWKKDEKARMFGTPRMSFNDLKTRLQIKINTLNSMNTRAAETRTAKVAATNVTQPVPAPRRSLPEASRNESYAGRVTKSPPLPQPTTRCAVCQGYHATVDCAMLAKLEADAKVKKLKDCSCCLSCINPGHIVKSCPFPLSRCQVCHGTHHTILHGRTYQSNPRLSPDAQTFEPAAGNNNNNRNRGGRPNNNNATQGPTEPTLAAAGASTASAAQVSTAPSVPPPAPQQSADGNPII